MPSSKWKLITVLLFACTVLLLWYRGSPDETTEIKTPQRDSLAKELASLTAFNESHYGQFELSENRWLNLTGFRASDGFTWTALQPTKERMLSQLNHIFGEEYAAKVIESNLTAKDSQVYRNVTGFITGKWVQSPIEKSMIRHFLNITALLPGHDESSKPFDRNISGSIGRIDVVLRPSVLLSDFSGMTTQSFVADMTIADDTSKGDGWQFQMAGVNIIESGSTFLTTTSTKFDGIFGLANLALSSRQFDMIKAQLSTSINRIFTRQQESGEYGLGPWLSTAEEEEGEFARPNCELVMYLQQHRPEQTTPSGLTYLDSSQIFAIEQELRFPKGQSGLSKPGLRMSMLAFSPDCGFVIESRGSPDYPSDESKGGANHLTGLKTEALAESRRYIALFLALLLLVQLRLLMSQMADTATPSTRSKISIWTVTILAWGDGLASMVLLPLGIGPGYGFPTVLGVAFIAFMSLTFFDLRFMMDVWSVQFLEQRRLDRQSRSRSSNRSREPVRPSSEDITEGLPIPVSSRQAVSFGATPIILPSDQDADQEQQQTGTANGAGADTEAAAIRRQLSGLYVRFYLLLFGTVFLSVYATTWRLGLRSVYMNFLVFVYLSWPLPQIYRNAMRNCRKAMQWRFIVGQSIVRAVPIAYIYGVPQNIIYMQTDLLSLTILVSWVWIQICLLTAQNLFKPRLCLPQTWVPPAYDYHPILREDDEESKLPLLARHSSTTEGGMRCFDCAICMQDVDVPIIASGTQDSQRSAVAGALGPTFMTRRGYMVTPCRHIFHTGCLESAMRYRLQCPVCREALPPL